MTDLRGYIMPALLLLLAGALSAQNIALLDKLYSDMSSSCVEMTYTYETEVSGVKAVGEGKLDVQREMWTMTGNGVQMWCDGKTLWVADPSLKEVVIEPASGEDGGAILTNPASLFVRMQELFNLTRSVESSDGKSVTFFMSPKTSGNMAFCNVELSKADASILSGVFAFNDGSDVHVKVSSMSLSPKRETEAFRPQIKFDSSWIVTDMR